MYCSNCGKQVPFGSNFCPACGAAYTPVNAGAATSGNFDGIVRPRNGRMVAGVCAGLALRYGWDVSIVRLLWVLAVVLAGTGLLVYIILWVAIPEESYVANIP